MRGLLLWIRRKFTDHLSKKRKKEKKGVRTRRKLNVVGKVHFAETSILIFLVYQYVVTCLCK